MAKLKGLSTVEFGYEKSADFGNRVYFDGLEVNHQYDKSSSFVRLAGGFVRDHLTKAVRLESALAHMWEIEISREFCQDPILRQFHSAFMSCNEPINDTRWCARCPKCAFLYLLLSSWLPQEEVWAVFGENLFEKEQLEKTFLSLVGAAQDGVKPFECVGTPGEAAACVELASRRIVMAEVLADARGGYDKDKDQDEDGSCGGI